MSTKTITDGIQVASETVSEHLRDCDELINCSINMWGGVTLHVENEAFDRIIGTAHHEFTAVDGIHCRAKEYGCEWVTIKHPVECEQCGGDGKQHEHVKHTVDSGKWKRTVGEETLVSDCEACDGTGYETDSA